MVTLCVGVGIATVAEVELAGVNGVAAAAAAAAIERKEGVIVTVTVTVDETVNAIVAETAAAAETVLRTPNLIPG